MAHITYELGILTTVGTTGVAALEIQAGSSRPMAILEMGITLNVATASSLTLGRPGNTPTGGTPTTATLPSSLSAGAGASAGGIILSGWGTAPTVPTAGNSLRMVQIPAAVGNGAIWNWEEGEMVVSPTRSSGLVIWNASTASVFRFYMKWIE